jgi:hypothetical protein
MSASESQLSLVCGGAMARMAVSGTRPAMKQLILAARQAG